MISEQELSDILEGHRDKNETMAHRFMALPSNGVYKLGIVSNEYAFLWYMPRSGGHDGIFGQWHENFFVCKEMGPQGGVPKMAIDAMFELEKNPFIMLVDNVARDYLGTGHKLEYGSLYKTPNTNIIVYKRDQFLQVPKEKLIHECMRLVNL